MSFTKNKRKLSNALKQGNAHPIFLCQMERKLQRNKRKEPGKCFIDPMRENGGILESIY